MRILYHHRTRAEDAQGVHIRALCQAFRGLGHEVRVIAPPRRPGPDQAAGVAQGRAASLFGRAIPQWVYEGLALAYNGPAFLVLVAAILWQRPALVYERYALFNVAGRLAAGLLRVPFVLEVNAPLSLEMQREGQLVFRRLAQRLEDWLFAHSTRTLVVSGAMGDILAERGVPRERLMVMPNGVDRAAFHPGVDGIRQRRTLGLSDRFVVGFVGWVRPWHGVDRLLAAAARLRDTVPELTVLIVGGGPAIPELQRQALALGLAERVRFTGPVDQARVPGYLAAMDVAVQPDVTEYASPIKLFEYLAMGKAVVAPNRANIAEVVSHGREALLFEPGDADELAGRLRTLWADPGRRRAMAERAAALVAERGFTWEANAARVAALVELRPAPEEAL
jgi:glycosyltransferase involved in cell wall biosynthesis